MQIESHNAWVGWSGKVLGFGICVVEKRASQGRVLKGKRTHDTLGVTTVCSLVQGSRAGAKGPEGEAPKCVGGACSEGCPAVQARWLLLVCSQMNGAVGRSPRSVPFILVFSCSAMQCGDPTCPEVSKHSVWPTSSYRMWFPRTRKNRDPRREI